MSGFSPTACETCEILIQRSVDGVLSPSDRERLDTHLMACAECRREWDAQHRLGYLADRWTRRPAAPSGPEDAFTAQVLARLDATPERSRPLSGLLPAAAALLLLALCVFLPGMPDSSALNPAASAPGLPHWVSANFLALPGDALTLLRLPQAYYLPPWAGIALGAMIALNAAFCVHARQSALWRTAS